jgi:hypothetical protein
MRHLQEGDVAADCRPCRARLEPRLRLIDRVWGKGEDRRQGVKLIRLSGKRVRRQRSPHGAAGLVR